MSGCSKWLTSIVLLMTSSILLVSTSLFASPLQKPQFKFQDLAGEPVLATMDVAQDKQGIIWIATQTGLYRYDGIEHKLFTNTAKQQSLLGNYIKTLFVDNLGYIWLGYENAGVSRFDPKSERFVHFSPSAANHNKQAYALSGGMIEDITQDTLGNIWLATNHGISQIQVIPTETAIGSKEKGENQAGIHSVENPQFQVIEYPDTAFAGHHTYAVAFDDQQRLWVGGASGLYHSQPDTNEPLVFNKLEVNGATVTSLLAISKQLWLGSNSQGIYALNLTNLSIKKRFSVASLTLAEGNKQPINWATNHIYDIAKDDVGNIWFGTNQGLGMKPVLSQTGSTQVVEHFWLYQHDPIDATSLKNNRVNNIFIDSMQRLWLTNNEVPQMLTTASARFKAVKVDITNPNSLQEKAIYSIDTDKQNNLWFSGRTTGVYQKKQASKSPDLIHHQTNIDSPFYLNYPDIKRVFQDTKKRYWLASYRNGVYKISPNSQNQTLYQHQPNNANSLTSNSRAEVIFEDSQQQIWIGNEAGLNLYNEKQDNFIRADFLGTKNQSVLSARVVTLSEVDGLIIVGTSDGRLFYLELISQKAARKAGQHSFENDENPTKSPVFKQLLTRTLNGEIMALDYISTLLVKGEDIWLASYGGGIVKAQLSWREQGFKGKKKIPVLTGEVFNQQQGLAENTVNSLFTDLADDNRLWLNTDVGVSVYYINQQRFYNFTKQDGLPTTYFYINCDEQLRNGDIYYCGPNGAMHFSPSDIQVSDVPPTVIFTNFYVNNTLQSVTFDTPQGQSNLLSPQLSPMSLSILRNAITHTKSVTLTHKQANFAFDFAALDYTAPMKNQYAYMLEGFDENWITTPAKRRHASYSNIPAGDYTFKVKASNNHGFWNEDGAKINISILPAWYFTWWAKTIWAVSFALFVLGFIRYRTHQHTKMFKQRSLELEQAVNEKTADVLLLSEVGKDLNASPKVEKIVMSCYQHLNEVMDAHSFLIGIVDQEKNELVVPLILENGNELKGIAYSLINAVRPAAWCITNKKPLVVQTKADWLKYGFDNIALLTPQAGLETASIVYYPLELDGNVIGCLSVQSMQTHAYSKSHLSIIETLSSYTSIAISHALSYKSLQQANQEVNSALAELKQAQKTIVQQEKMSSLGTLSAGIAHEINNPTNFVYGSCQNMAADLEGFKTFLHDLAGEDADEEVLAAFESQFKPLFEHVDVISDGAQRIKTIVDGMSVFARTDKEEMESTSIRQCIETTVGLVNTEYKDVTKFNLVFNDSPNVLCYPSKINQVLMNLLVNASQAIKSRKEAINQESAADYFGGITVTTSVKDNMCQITIKDNGKGIKNEDVEKIFEPFFTTKTVGSGTGLGLALSYEIVQQHDGKLEVNSQLGEGSVFTLILPINGEKQ